LKRSNVAKNKSGSKLLKLGEKNSDKIIMGILKADVIGVCRRDYCQRHVVLMLQPKTQAQGFVMPLVRHA